MASQSEQTCMLAVKNGDTDQMRYVYERYKDPLMGFFYRLTGGDRGLSEDLLQTVFLRALKYRTSYREGAAIKPWLFQMARHVFYDYTEKQKPWQRTEDLESYRDQLADATRASLQHQLEQKDHQRMLHMALRKLPPDARELIELCRYQELPYKEVARMLEITEGNVKVKLHRAIRRLGNIFLSMTNEHES